MLPCSIQRISGGTDIDEKDRIIIDLDADIFGVPFFFCGQINGHVKDHDP